MAKRKIAGEIPKLIPQPNGGALLSGGVPGHKGGPGRPPSEVRRAFLDALHGGPEALQRIITSTGSRDADRIAAIAAAAKIGLPFQVEGVPATPLTPAERVHQVARLLKGKV